MNSIVVARTLLISFLVVTGMTWSGKNLIKNGAFDNFAGTEPVGWTTSNIPKMLTVVSPTTQSHSGKYAVKCEVKDFYGSKYAGMITQKNVEISGTVMRLSGEYVLNSVGKDVGFIALDFLNTEGNTVKVCQENLAAPSTAFIPFTITGNVPPGAVHVDIKLTLLPGPEAEKLHEGSYILFDDLELVPVSLEGEILPQ
jgi:hypothetical protein